MRELLVGNRKKLVSGQTCHHVQDREDIDDEPQLFVGKKGVDGDEDQAWQSEDQGLGLPPANVCTHPNQDEGEAGGHGPLIWSGMLTNYTIPFFSVRG